MTTASFPSQPLAARALRNFLLHSGHVPLVPLIAGLAPSQWREIFVKGKRMALRAGVVSSA